MIPVQTTQTLIPTQTSIVQPTVSTSSSDLATTRTTKSEHTKRPRPKTTATNSLSTTETSVASFDTLTSQRSSTTSTYTFDATVTTMNPIETVSDIMSIVNETLIEGVVIIDPEIITHFDVDGISYSVVSSINNNSTDASVACQRKNATISDMTSDDYDKVSIKLQTTIASGSKLIISSWNNNSYSFFGDNCMILQVNYGIYPGSCLESTGVLCQS